MSAEKRLVNRKRALEAALKERVALDERIDALKAEISAVKGAK